MPQRITILLDDDLVKKLRSLQAKQIKETETSVSFSRILNDVLKKSLKSSDSNHRTNASQKK